MGAACKARSRVALGNNRKRREITVKKDARGRKPIRYKGKTCSRKTREQKRKNWMWKL
jgi:hypothetical protein